MTLMVSRKSSGSSGGGTPSGIDDSRRGELESIVAWSRSMLTRVEEGAWDEIVSMETHRQELLNTFFSVEPKKTEAKWIADLIQEIMQINADMEDACRKQLQQLSSTIGALSHDPE